MEKCACCFVDQIDGFDGWEDYKLFLKKIDQLISENILTEIPIDIKYQKEANFFTTGKWFKCTKCGKCWRLVEPDPPLRGLWVPLPKHIKPLPNRKYRWK